MSDYPHISQYIDLQSTEYIRNTFPPILDFLEAYFTWMEQNQTSPYLGTTQGIFSLLGQRDIDTSLSGFLKYFQFEFLPGIPTNLLADPRKLIKHIKDFNLARGSEASFRLLFRILYNDSIIFYYPKRDIIIPSDGKWSVDTVIRTTTTHDTSQFISKKITGVTSGATANVENVILKTIGAYTVSEMYISGLLGTFQIGEHISITSPSIYETAYGLATGVTLTNPGTAYQPDDIIAVTGGNKTALFSVNVVGGIESGRVVTSTNFPSTIRLAATASVTNNHYNKMYITIIDGTGAGQTKQILSYVGSTKVATVDTTWLVRPDITSHYNIALGNIKTIKVNDFGINYSTTIAADFTLSGNGDATGTIIAGAVGHYAGRYVNNDGFLSAKKYIQDSYFYQNYSYVLKTHELLSDYIDVVKKLLHPAGLILFGDNLIDGRNFVRKTHNNSGIISLIPVIFTYYIDPLTGSDSNDGSSTAMWETTTPADAVILTGTQTIGYKYNGMWLLYRTLNETADMSTLPVDIITETTDKF